MKETLERYDIFEQMILKLKNHQEFMAYVIHKYMEHNCVSFNQIADAFGCSYDSLQKLALCKNPDRNEDRMRTISNFTNVKIARIRELVEFIRSHDKLPTEHRKG